MGDERQASTISGGALSAASRTRRRVPALLAFLLVAAILVSTYDLLLLALGL